MVEVEVVVVTEDTGPPPAKGMTPTEDRLHTMTTTDTLQGMTAEDLPQKGDYNSILKIFSSSLLIHVIF